MSRSASRAGPPRESKSRGTAGGGKAKTWPTAEGGLTFMGASIQEMIRELMERIQSRDLDLLSDRFRALADVLDRLEARDLVVADRSNFVEARRQFKRYLGRSQQGVESDSWKSINNFDEVLPVCKQLIEVLQNYSIKGDDS
jgi:hypothetical protein